jgi:hypothetical protein
MKKLVWALILTGSMLAGTVALAPGEQPGHMMVKPADVKWADGPPSLPPGIKIAVIEGDLTKPVPFTFRIKAPANYKVAPHWHPAIEHVTVLSGVFNIGMGEEFDTNKLTPMPAGSFTFMQPKTPHFVLIKEETIIQVHGVGPWGLTYVNPADDPRKK